MYRTTQFWHVLMTIFCTCTNLHVTRLWCKKIPRQIMPIIDQYWMAHCPKNNLNLGIKTEPVTYGSDATVYSRSCLMLMGYTYEYCTRYTYVPLHALQPWQARFLCSDSDYFWVRVYIWSRDTLTTYLSHHIHR